jgi:hypothetical protein
MKKTHPSEQRNLCGKRIRKMRLAAKPVVSQDDLSGRLARLGVVLDQGAISRIESQDRYLMDYELIAIAKALRIKPSALVDQ